MSAQKGKDLLLKVDSDGAGTFVTVAGLRSRSIAFNTETVAGYGAAAANVPAPIRQSILLLVAHWHEHREPIAIGAPGAPVPPTVSDLLQPYRQVRL